MINQQIYIVNGRPAVRVIHQPGFLDPRIQHNIYAPPPSYFQPMSQPRIQAVEGMEVVEEYDAEAGDPVVIEEAVFKGEVVQVGNREKEVIDESEAIVVSQGYASEDGKMWKPLPKIMMTTFKIGQLYIMTITKVKAKFDSALPNHKIMKVTCGNSDYYLGFKEKVFNEWFLRLIWAKLMIDRREIEEYGVWGSSISGRVYKKSQFLGEWEPRFVSVSKAGLLSSKDERSSPSLQIKDTKQIWTRFQELKGGVFMVVKLWYGIIKEEFAIPIREALRWLYHILVLLRLS